VSYPSRETSRYSGQPFELYLFESGLEAWRFTSGDKARSYNSKLYTPETITRTEIDQNQELSSGSIKVEIPKTNDVASRFVSYIPEAPLSLVIFRGHDGEADSETVMNFTGRVASAMFVGEVCELTVVPEQDVLKRRVLGPKYQCQCNRVLYDAGCGVDKNSFKLTGVVSSVSADLVTATVFTSQANGWLDAGYLEKGTQRRMIISHTGNQVRLIAPMDGLVVGDTVTAYAGCMRTRAVCLAKFNNLAKFFGFDKIPTKNPFNGVE
jgi:uncharacterized phage protein (TIGR02218 family)